VPSMSGALAFGLGSSAKAGGKAAGHRNATHGQTIRSLRPSIAFITSLRQHGLLATTFPGTRCRAHRQPVRRHITLSPGAGGVTGAQQPASPAGSQGFARLNVMRTYPDPFLASKAVGRALSGSGPLSHVVSVSPSRA